jgi:hypothetical protein
MNYLVIVAVLALLGPLPSTGHFQAYRPPIETKAGDVATGAVVRQDTNTLILNTTPCSGDREKQIVIFHSPFGTQSASPASCPGGTTIQQVTVSQR